MNPAAAFPVRSRRLLVARPAFRDAAARAAGVPDAGDWPAAWVTCGESPPPPFVVAYRLAFVSPAAESLRLHVTADERYELFLDGHRVGRGPERGDARHWFYETYELELPAGPHLLVARVWSLGPDQAPTAQVSVAPGFLACPDQGEDVPRLATGIAPWEALTLSGISFLSPLSAWGSGARIQIDGARFPWGFERGEGIGWTPARPRAKARDACDGTAERVTPVLCPAMLPPMLDQPVGVGRVRHVGDYVGGETSQTPIAVADHLADESPAWDQLLRHGRRLVLPPRTGRRVIVDLEDYYCGYLAVTTTGGAGASIRVHWQESLFDDPLAKTKGDRGAVAGKYFTTIWHLRDGVGNRYLSDGGANRVFAPLWWEAGRYLELLVQTGEEPLAIEALTLRETRYPLERTARFTSSEPMLDTAWSIMRRTLELCSHETFLDCPFYEQLMYVGDSRIEALLTYVLTTDVRLPQKAIRAFAWSQLPSGITLSRYPCSVRQVIPPFSLLWIGMIHDHAVWRGDAALVREHAEAIEAVLDYFERYATSSGLLLSPPGWNFVDWVPAWPHGVPPGGMGGISTILNLFYVAALRQAADLLAWTGAPGKARQRREQAFTVGRAIHAQFWDAERQRFADDLNHEHASEHTQCLAVLALGDDATFDPFARFHEPGPAWSEADPALASAVAAASRALLEPHEGMTRTTISFSHYHFEALARLGHSPVDHFGRWLALPAHGFKTTREGPEPSRSDCHAWSAHPLAHCYTGVLGIRPAAPGFATVVVRPQLGALTFAEGTMPHPAGEIAARIEQAGGRIRGRITLPPGVRGTLRANDQTLPLEPGDNVFA